MRRCRPFCSGAVLALLTACVAQAEVKVTVDRNRAAEASPRFTFTNVPPPAKNDAAGTALFTLIGGRRDENGGDLVTLHDGHLPGTQDDPAKNFFFAQGQDGGRLVIDLGKTIEVGQVNTYSWHPNTRGPQVYKLYAADGTAPGFDRQPKMDTDPATCGWTLVTAVDCRPAHGRGGGQYGVSVAGSPGPIGSYRHLLFDFSATEQRDPFGNTFYSEIDVIDAAGPKRLEPAAPAARAVSNSPASAPYQITIDYAEAPALKEWVLTKLQPAADTWYPKIVEALPSERYNAPRRVAITISSGYRGVAATSGTRVVCSLDWLQRNYNGEGVGAVVHELVHVVQQYGHVRGGAPNPGWLVEGVADYIRWFKYEPVPAGTRPRNPATASYTDSYRTTAGFLNYVVEFHDKQIVTRLNAAMREGRYSNDLWKEFTGKTVDELWQEYVATLERRPK